MMLSAADLAAYKRSQALARDVLKAIRAQIGLARQRRAWVRPAAS